MPAQERPVKAHFRLIANFLILSALFAAAYTQSPLYTSNQNQYFLHGLADAGYGNLDQDWLANTLDPTPVFSKLVELTYRYLHRESIYYVYYALLMGIYAASLFGIVDILLDLRSSRLKGLTFMAAFIAIHSAGLRFALSHGLGSNWAYVLEDGVADQRMLGSVFQPSVFAVFLALSLLLFLQRKPVLALLAVAVAVTFHPTYLLSAALLTLAYALAAWVEEKKLVTSIWYGLIALVLVSPTLYYVMTSFGGTSPEVSARAQEILINLRIPHHTLVSQWLDATVLVKLVLIAAAIILLYRQEHFTHWDGDKRSPAWRLALVLLVTATFAVLLTLLQVVTASKLLALLFPWRISILLVPLATSLLLGYLVERLIGQASPRRVLSLVSTLIIFLCVLAGGIRFKLDLERKIALPERPLENYIYAQHSSGDQYLTPIDLQDFRLAARAPVYIDFKSIPYRDTDVLEWRRRFRLADKFYDKGDCDILAALVQDEHITQVVLPATLPVPACSGLEEIYRDKYYVLAHTEMK